MGGLVPEGSFESDSVSRGGEGLVEEGEGGRYSASRKRPRENIITARA